MGGTWKRGSWNIAIGPDAWEMMFEAIPSACLGLEWEPCHQLLCLADPLCQLERWAPRVFHVHGKDAHINWDVIRERGLFGDKARRAKRLSKTRALKVRVRGMLSPRSPSSVSK